LSENIYKGDINAYLNENTGGFSYERGRTSRELYHRLIDKIEETAHIRNDAYKEVLRGLLSNLKIYYIDSQSNAIDVKLHHGRQERAVAKMFQENNLVLPYASIYQFSIDNDETKRRYDSMIMSKAYWDDEKQKAIRVISLADVPVKATYALNIWTKYISDMDQISSLIRSKFNPEVRIKTPFSKSIKAYLAQETDNSVVELGDREDRIIRKTFLISTEFYIPSPNFQITSTGQIEEIHLDTFFRE
jgi:hypothetical protein